LILTPVTFSISCHTGKFWVKLAAAYGLSGIATVSVTEPSVTIGIGLEGDPELLASAEAEGAGDGVDAFLEAASSEPDFEQPAAAIAHVMRKASAAVADFLLFMRTLFSYS
jgi:hypothetical protein